MTKDEMISLLRVAGCDTNTVTAMSNAFDLGFEDAIDRVKATIRSQIATTYDQGNLSFLIEQIGRLEP